jgi:hypothetical protein
MSRYTSWPTNTATKSTAAVRHRMMYVILTSARLYPSLSLVAKSVRTATYRTGTSARWKIRYMLDL